VGVTEQHETKPNNFCNFRCRLQVYLSYSSSRGFATTKLGHIDFLTCLLDNIKYQGCDTSSEVNHILKTIVFFSLSVTNVRIYIVWLIYVQLKVHCSWALHSLASVLVVRTIRHVLIVNHATVTLQS